MLFLTYSKEFIKICRFHSLYYIQNRPPKIDTGRKNGCHEPFKETLVNLPAR